MQKTSLFLLTLAPIWVMAQTQTPIEPPRRQVPPPATPSSTPGTATAPGTTATEKPRITLPGGAPNATPPPLPTPADAAAAAGNASGAPVTPKPSIASGLPPEVQARMKAAQEKAQADKLRSEQMKAAAAAAANGNGNGIPTPPPAPIRTVAGANGATPPPPPGPGASLDPATGLPMPISGSNAAAPASTSGPGVDPEVKTKSYIKFFDEPSVTLDIIVETYEQLTGKTVIRTPSMFSGGGGGGGGPTPPQPPGSPIIPGGGGGGAGGGGGTGALIPVVINPNQEYSKEQWLDFIRATLMVNGYGLHEYNEKIDIITFNGQPSPLFTTAPPKEGHRVYMREGDLPPTDQFVNYFMKLEHISVQDATTILGQPAHQSGKITPVANANGILITESVPVVKSLIKIQKEIDVVNGIETINKFVQLFIADAEEVAQVMTQMLQQQSQAKSGAGGQAAPTRLVSSGNAAQQMSNALAGNPGAPQISGASQAAPDPSSVFVQADRRTHRILLSGPRKDVEYLEKLIKDFDKPSELKDFFSYKLRYLKVNEFLTIAATTLEAAGYGTATGSGGGGGAAGGAGGASGSSRSSSGQNPFSSGGMSGGSSRMSTSASSSRGGSSSMGGSAFGGSSSFGGSGGFGGSSGAGGGRSGSGGTGGSGGLGAEVLPEAMSVGKILLVSSPQNNTIVVSGPPEALGKMKELLAQIDIRPMQVHIDCIIAEITLTDDVSWGLDALRRLDSGRIGGSNIDFGAMLKNTGNTGIIDPIALTTNAAFTSAAPASGINGYLQVGELVSAYVKANESTGRVRVLQKPSVSASNLKPARINVGREVPYSSGVNSGINSTGSFNSYTDFKEVLLSLDVTPLINSKNEVTLQIMETNDNVIGSTNISGSPVPILGRQDLQTELTVPNQGIAVIGGLISDSRDTNNAGTPLLARIPIIKHIFGSTNKKDSRREMIIFIQPRIMETGDEMLEVNNSEVQRTILGKDAEEFARPGFKTDGVVVPTEHGDIPFDSQGYVKKQGWFQRIFGKKEIQSATELPNPPKAAPKPQPVAEPLYPRKK